MSADLFSLSLYVSLSLFFLSLLRRGRCRRTATKRNLFAWNGRRTSKTAAKLRFWGVDRNPFAPNWRRTSKRCRSQHFRTKWTSKVKNWSKIAILRCPAQPFRTKRMSNVENWGKILIFAILVATLLQETDVERENWGKDTFFFPKIWPVSHETDVEREKHWKTEAKIRFFLLKFEPFRTKQTSNVKSWGKIGFSYQTFNCLARNGCWTSKTVVILWFWSLCG